MFQHLFASMHAMLDEILKQYSKGSPEEKQHYEQQLEELKQVSDMIMEQWITFEEKLAAHSAVAVATPAIPCHACDLDIPDEAEPFMSKGQGYYKLFMFSHAAAQFQTVVQQSPDCNLARLFLGMCYMHLQNWNEAQRHFLLLIGLSEFPKWLAMGYNALGCIQAVRMNLAQAEHLFRKAYDVYPSFKDSLSNLRCCQETPDQLSLYFGSTELCCL